MREEYETQEADNSKIRENTRRKEKNFQKKCRKVANMAGEKALIFVLFFWSVFFLSSLPVKLLSSHINRSVIVTALPKMIFFKLFASVLVKRQQFMLGYWCKILKDGILR